MTIMMMSSDVHSVCWSALSSLSLRKWAGGSGLAVTALVLLLLAVGVASWVLENSDEEVSSRSSS